MTDAGLADDPLAALPLLAGLDEATRRALAATCRPRALAAGELLFRAGDAGDAMYFVQSGTLVAYLDAPDGHHEAVGRIGAGEAVGEMALLTGKPRSTHVMALRDARLLRLARDDFECILGHHPDAMLAFARGMAARLDAANHAIDRPPERTRTIALLPLDGDVNAAQLADALRAAATTLLGAGRAVSLAADAPDFATALATAEATRELVVLHAGGAAEDAAAQTQRAARHADLRLLVVDAQQLPPPAAVLAAHPALRDVGDFQRTEVVLCHGDRIVPGAAAEWLGTIEDALHTLRRDAPEASSSRAPSASMPRGRPLHHHLRRAGPAAEGDLARLLRFALGRATGIVLSGGGARGFAHLGVMRALEEAGIVIDCVAGASIGAIMGASHAQEWSYEQRLATFRRTFGESDPLGDYTLPRVSLVRGRRVSARLQAGFGDADILDLALPFCCLSADLDAGAARQHRSGLLWRALRASCAIPGVLPPVVGEREMLVDGSVIDNFPIDALRDRRPARLIGVDISAEIRLGTGRDSTHAPAWWELGAWREYRRTVPGLAQLLVGAAMVGSRSAKASARGAVQLLLEPPLPDVGLLDWRAFDRIVEAGYAYAREVIVRD